MSDLPQRKGRPAYMQPQQFGGEPEQLRMFMTRGEIAKDYHPIDHVIGGTAEFWAGKAREARSHESARGLIHGAGVWDSVRETGVQNPVHLAEYEPDSVTGKAIVGGHHRIISARKGELIPVMHHDSLKRAKSGGIAMEDGLRTLQKAPWQKAYGRDYD